jgi:hypothetical protein
MPAFAAAERLGLTSIFAGLLFSMLVLSLVARLLESSTLAEDSAHDPQDLLPRPLRWVPFSHVLGMGTSWALTRATVEAFGRGQSWDVTPKEGQVAGRATRSPLALRGTSIVAVVSTALGALAASTGDPLMMFFYGTLSLGSVWVVGAILLEGRPRR